jgi:hypothetical protein
MAETTGRIEERKTDAFMFCFLMFGVPLALVILAEIVDLPAVLAAWAGRLF